MLKSGVSDELYSVIQKLMNEPLFDDFLLGGGTNLAIKYNHRLSTDIDLFSTPIVGTEKLNLICQYVEKEFGLENVIINKQNFDSEQYAWLQITLIKDSIKLDIIQNLKLLHEYELKDGIRLISDIDIGALKLLAAADRGHQKDFYDLYLLSEKMELEVYYDNLQKRKITFPKESDKSIFDIENGKPIDRLGTSLTPLGNFNKAGDKKNPGNRIEFTKDSQLKIAWPYLREKWVEKVELLAKSKDLTFKRTAKKGKGLFRFLR
tara:strand:- start:448 stop:1236 length:789 start_codon:yes stop_codon:yes gene_type:complete